MPTLIDRPPSSSIIIQNGDPPVENNELPGWAIALIIIIVLLLLCCIGYAIFAMCFKRDNDSNEVHNNIYMDEKNRNGSRGGDGYFLDEKSHVSRKSRQTRGSRRPRIAEVAYEEEEEENTDEVQIVLSQPQNPRFDDDSFSINTYGTRTPKRQGRDPTMYIPGQEDRPDPPDAPCRRGIQDPTGRTTRGLEPLGEDRPHTGQEPEALPLEPGPAEGQHLPGPRRREGA